ncbi:hypothetical protein R3P38DRAFT_2762201 [Favolaschia claudopus]|uniref:Uncharacterized protein n=1 Tax=Favolaschia claudopus TaxID=2862362 RepID=A0AAW0DJG9_9AGAR
MSQMVYRPWLELKRLNGARRVEYHWVNRTSQRAAFREKVSESTGIHGVIGILGRNSRRINCHCEELLRITGIHGVARNPQRRLPTRCQQENKKNTVKQSQHQLESSPVGHYNDSAEKYCWNQICPKYLANHGSVTANGLTGLVDVLCRLERKPLELKRLNGARRVNYHRVSGVLARFRDIDFNGYRHCVNPNTPIKAIRNPARQHQSRDVKVGDNPTAQTLSFGKEIEEHAIQQGNVRVNNGMQQDIGELAAHSSPLSGLIPSKGSSNEWNYAQQRQRGRELGPTHEKRLQNPGNYAQQLELGPTRILPESSE